MVARHLAFCTLWIICPISSKSDIHHIGPLGVRTCGEIDHTTLDEAVPMFSIPKRSHVEVPIRSVEIGEKTEFVLPTNGLDVTFANLHFPRGSSRLGTPTTLSYHLRFRFFAKTFLCSLAPCSPENASTMRSTVRRRKVGQFSCQSPSRLQISRRLTPNVDAHPHLGQRLPSDSWLYSYAMSTFDKTVPSPSCRGHHSLRTAAEAPPLEL